MTDATPIKKLQKVNEYYRQRLQSMVTRQTQRNLELARLKADLSQQQQGLQQMHDDATRLGGEVTFRLQAVTSAERLEALIVQCHDRITTQITQITEGREEIRQQMGRIESLDRLIERKQELLNTHVRQQEQNMADERYLSQHFTGDAR